MSTGNITTPALKNINTYASPVNQKSSRTQQEPSLISTLILSERSKKVSVKPVGKIDRNMI
jgi:hypothetical protein